MTNLEEREIFGDYKRNPLPRYIWVGVILLILIFVLSFGVIYYRSLSARFTTSASKSLIELKGGIADLKQLQASSAEEKFRAAGENLDPSFGSLLSKLRFFFGAANDTLSGFGNISSQGITIAQETDFLQGNVFDLALDHKGDKIMSSLKNIKQALEKIDFEGNTISSNIGKFSPVSEEFVNLYLPLRLNLASIDKFLDSFISWLDSDSTHHILALLQNPSEIRPSGGFLGSYADISVNKGNIENVEIHDINDADRLFERKIIPPKPLQAIVTSWRAADANWFFDFRASAEHVIKFVESSKLYPHTNSVDAEATHTKDQNLPRIGVGVYRDKSLTHTPDPAAAGSVRGSALQSFTFDGAVAIGPRVITDILSLTGPISLKESRITLDQNNLLLELQREVQVGQSKKVTYPKKVLEEFSTALLSKVKTLDDQKKRELLRVLQDRLQSKDIMLYLKNQNLENFFDAYGFSGKVSDLPPDKAASYLAVVDSNIGGGKSDLYIKQEVSLQSQINTDGTVGNHLSLERKHEGNKAKYWWYKVDNVDYLQIFTPPASRLVNFQGGVEKKIIAPTDYSKNGFIADDLVQKIESSEEKVWNFSGVAAHDESGKKVFSTWVRTKAGGTSKVIFGYTHRLFLPPAQGLKYEFIFDKQAGTARRYKFEITAPVGFKFAETGSPAYEYETDDPPGTLKIDLTLEKI